MLKQEQMPLAFDDSDSSEDDSPRLEGADPGHDLCLILACIFPHHIFRAIHGRGIY